MNPSKSSQTLIVLQTQYENHITLEKITTENLNLRQIISKMMMFETYRMDIFTFLFILMIQAILVFPSSKNFEHKKL